MLKLLSDRWIFWFFRLLIIDWVSVRFLNNEFLVILILRWFVGKLVLVSSLMIFCVSQGFFNCVGEMFIDRLSDVF